jgi:hypothetical protein
VLARPGTGPGIIHHQLRKGRFMSDQIPDHIGEARALWRGQEDTAQAYQPAHPPADYPGLPVARPQPVPAVQYQPVMQAPAARTGVATAALVLGIGSVIFCWWGLFTLAMVVLAITFGAIGIQRANENGAGKGMAVAGLVLGSVGAVAYFIFGIVTLGVGFLI